MLHQSKAFLFVCSISYDMQVPLLSFWRMTVASPVSSITFPYTDAQGQTKSEHCFNQAKQLKRTKNQRVSKYSHILIIQRRITMNDFMFTALLDC